MSRPPASSWAWIWQALSGLLLILLLAVHMIANHFIVPTGLRTYADVLAYLRNPIIFIWETLFLAVVTWHALLGIRAILFDLGLTPRTERAVTRVLTVLGLLTVAYGLWLTLTIIK